jgi:putative toxin-antitoxin system antitoxin component (TIGR02293 family)
VALIYLGKLPKLWWQIANEESHMSKAIERKSARMIKKSVRKVVEGDLLKFAGAQGSSNIVQAPLRIIAGAEFSETKLMAVQAAKRIAVVRLRDLEKAGWLSSNEVFVHVIPKRTLSHRIAKKEPLSTEESDRLLRLARLTEQAVRVFGNAEKAKAWLRKSSLRFGDKTPLDMADTEHGGRVVEEALVQLDEGMFV